MDNNQNSIDTGFKGVFPGTSNSDNQLINPNKQNNIINLENKENIVDNISQENSAQTYMKLETKNDKGELSGVLEIDLISFRERGQESRYLSIDATGVGRDGQQSDTTISINNEKDFNNFKEFISNLNWND